jgi:membrane protease YdiL (CAAX protease family)
MAGFSARCSCGEMVPFPAPVESRLPASSPPARALARSLARRRREEQAALLPGQLPVVVTARGELHGRLRHASVREQQRETNATFVDIVLCLGAFIGIHLLFTGYFPEEGQALAWPLSGLVAGFLVLLISLRSPASTFGTLRAAPAHFQLEAAVVAFTAAATAIGYSSLIDGPTGLEPLLDMPLVSLLIAVAVCPAIFEELAFRGLIQYRLTALTDPALGVILSGTAFALCHGVTLGFPFHVGLGLYLGWLRLRSGSLLPGMLAHGLYNATIVIVERSL